MATCTGLRSLMKCWRLQWRRLVVIALGLTHEFGDNEHLATTSRFLYIQTIDSNDKNLDYNEHPVTRSSFSCIFLLCKRVPSAYHHRRIQGGTRDAPLPLSVQFLSFSRSFQQKSCQIIDFCLKLGVGTSV